MPDPSPFQGMKEILGSLAIDNRGRLVLGGDVNHAEDGELLLRQLDPHDIALQFLVEGGSGCGLSRQWGVRFVVSAACHTVEFPGNFKIHLRGSTAG